MVDFRKWLMASAAAALLFGLGSSAYAQNSTNFLCNATGANSHVVRAEGVAELVGDMVLNCTGGTITPFNQPIPLTNVQINLNTNVTSRLVGAPGSNHSEAILAIDEPFPTNNGGPSPTTALQFTGSANTQSACIADGLTNCGINGTGVALNFGANGPYNGTNGATNPTLAGGNPNSTGNHYNLFQGIWSPSSLGQITWLGVPIDAPGTASTRVIRVTNIRANICLLTPGTSLLPTQILELIGFNGSQNITINNPQQVVALAEKGLLGSVNPRPAFGPPSYQQCNNLNATLLGLPFDGVSDTIEFVGTEGFGAAFKAPVLFNSGTGAVVLQNVLGFAYNTESGFYPGASVAGFDQAGHAIGLADVGTEVTFSLNAIPAGVSLFAPNSVNLVDSLGAPTGGFARLIGTFGVGSSFNPGVGTGLSQVTFSGTSASITYEIFADDPNAVESLIVGVKAAFINSSSTIPGSGTATVAINFAPPSTATQGTASGSAPIPRFCQTYGPQTAFTIAPCTCNLLFPFVTNVAGFDTGIAIANTTQDPFLTVAQTGTVVLNYYGTPSGTPQAISSAITGGQELIFTLSNGGNFGVPATPGFQGYIIAQANFQFCHGFAFISDVGAQKLAEGYLAINLDVPGLNRTLNTGENEGH